MHYWHVGCQHLFTNTMKSAMANVEVNYIAEISSTPWLYYDINWNPQWETPSW